MKKQLLLFVLTILPIMASAEAVEINGIYYNLNTETKEAEVTSNPSKYTGEVTIPDKVTHENVEYRVTSIGIQAFAYCNITFITIPHSVTSVKYGAFMYSDLTSVFIPKNVTSIANDAFNGCYKLISVTISDGVTSIGAGAFYSCRGLISITIPSSVRSISSAAFSGCSSLTSIKVENGNPNYESPDNCNVIIEKSSNTLILGCKNTIIPNSVISIGSFAFSECTGLTSLNIPNSVTSIGYSAFNGCTGLTSLIIPNSITSIGYSAFSGCTGLTSIEVENGNPNYESPNNSNVIIEKSSNMLILGCKNTIIPNSVISIGSSAFSECTGLTSINIPNSVISIGDRAFYFCSGLTSLTIPNSVTSIGNRAFYYCSGLTTVTSEIENPFKIDASVFKCIPTNAQLIVPQGTKTAYEETEGWNVFTNIVEVDDASGTSPVTVEINGINYYLNPSLKQAKVVDKSSKYKGYVRIPDKVTYNKIEYSVTSFGDCAFEKCSDLISVTIPNSITSIEEGVFLRCGSLTSVAIPNSLTNIRYAAFRGCSSRLCFYITDLEAWCNVIFDYSLEAHHLFLNGVEIKDLIIPNSVTSIGNNAFSGCIGLTSVTIPNSVTSIGSNVFSSCSGLTSIIIPNSVTSIEGNSFNGCAASVILENGNPKYDSRDNCNAIIETSTNTLIVGFKNTVIPNSVTAIGNSAFSGCSSLTSLTIPNSVTAIGNSAFWGCSELTSIVLENNNPISGNGLFSNETYNKATLIVPVGTKATYQSSEEWGKFQNIIESGEGGIIDQEFVADGIRYKTGENNTVSVIEDKNMKNTSGGIVIPNQVIYNGIEYQVTSIGNSAFEWCDRLTSMTIPNSVTSIGTNAFGGCAFKKIVTEIVNPFSIEENVFKGVPFNTKVIVPEGSKAKYLATEGWNRFINIIEKNSPEGDVNDEDDDFNALGTPLTFEAIEGTVTVNVRNYFCSNTPTIQYRVDNGPWTDFTLTHTECHGAPLYSNFIPAGKIVQLRCNDWPYMLNRLDESSAADGLSILCDADCYVYGNVMSLETYYYSTEYDQECSLSWLFYQNTHIKNHPTKALVLPSKTLGCNSYTGMFYGCTGLKVAPELPAIELSENYTYRGGCYESMFQGCTSLIAAPVLPASVLTECCYKNMFGGCTKLNAVTSYATDISAKDATQNWLLGVSSTGTFTKFPLMNAWGKGASGIPYGWNIVVDSSQGDLNGDGKVTITDVGLMIDYIKNPSDGFNVKLADLNHDGVVTLIDVMMVLDIILNSTDE